MTEYIPIDLKTPYAIYIQYAEDPETPREILNKLSKHTYPKFRWVLAKNPAITPLIIKRLMVDPEKKVRAELASNPKLPAKVLDTLATDSERDVLYEVAGNPNTSIETLIKLSNHTNIDIKHSLARNPNTPESLLREFVNIEDEGIFPIQGVLAYNPKVPMDILSRIMDIDYDNSVTLQDILITSSENPNITKPIIRKIIKKSIAAGATKALINLINNPKVPEDFLYPISKVDDKEIQDALEKRLGSEIKKNFELAKRSISDALVSSDVSLLNELVKLNNFDINIALSKNPNITDNISEKFIKQKNFYTFGNLIANPSTSEHILDTLLSTDYIKQYLIAIFKHPNMTSKLIEKYYTIWGDKEPFIFLVSPKTPKNIQLDILMENRKDMALLDRLSSYKNTPQTVLQAVYRLGSDKIKRNVLERPDVPIKLLNTEKNKYKTKIKKYIDKGQNKNLNFKDTYSQKIKHNTSQDLELLKRLKGYLK